MALTEMQEREKANLERRIEILENALADDTTLSNVSTGGVSETVDREKLERELNRTRTYYETRYGGRSQVFGVVLH